MAFWDTAGNIIGDAAVELKLVSFQAKPADPFASTDPNIGQLCQLLTSLGRDFQRAREWAHLKVAYTFDTVQGQALYALPNDFGRMINQTGWNRTNRMPLGGPLSSQEWQYLEGLLPGITLTVLFRPYQGQLQLFPDTNTPGGYTIAYEYVSRFWVGATASAPGTSDRADASSDYVLFDPQLAMRGLKLAFLRANGLDSTAAEQDFSDAWTQAEAEDVPGRVLDMGRPKLLRVPLIGDQNVPITNVGS